MRLLHPGVGLACDLVRVAQEGEPFSRWLQRWRRTQDGARHHLDREFPYLRDDTGIDDAEKADPAYLHGKPVPLDLMVYQGDLGLRWLKEGRVCDLVILGNTHLYIGSPTAPWIGEWIEKHAGEELIR